MKRAYKKLLILIPFLFISFLSTTSCVSKKKYDAALQEIARLSVDKEFQEYELVDTVYQKTEKIYDKKKKINRLETDSAMQKSDRRKY